MRSLSCLGMERDGFGTAMNRAFRPRSLAPETCFDVATFANLVQDRVRQAKAERVMVLRARVTAWLRYWRSLAWWQEPSMQRFFDPVGETSKPIVTGPNQIPSSSQENRDDSRQEVVAEPEGEEGVGAAIAIGGSGPGGHPSACGRDRCGQQRPLRGGTAGAGPAAGTPV